jgi:cytochrome P450
VTQIVYELLFAGHETTTGLIARKARRPDFELSLARLNEQSRSVRDRAGMIRHEEGAMRTKADGDSSVRWGERFEVGTIEDRTGHPCFRDEGVRIGKVWIMKWIDYWVVTRYHDIRQIFQTPKRFSAANTLAPLLPICPGAGHLLAEGGFRPVPTLTNSDPPAHIRVRRLATIAFTPRRVAAREPLVRELTAQSVEKRLSSGRADLVRDLAWDLSALVIFRVLGIPDEDVARVKAGAESRLLLMWGRSNSERHRGGAPLRLLGHRLAPQDNRSGGDRRRACPGRREPASAARLGEPHLSLGFGAHYCLGAPLAHLEARIVLEELSPRLPSLRLIPGQTLRFQSNTTFRGPLSLLVQWDT